MRKICLLWNYIRLRSTKIFQGCLASCSQPRVDNSSQNDPEDTDDPARCELPSLLGRISPIAPMNYYESDPLPGIQFSHASTTWNIYIWLYIELHYIMQTKACFWFWVIYWRWTILLYLSENTCGVFARKTLIGKLHGWQQVAYIINCRVRWCTVVKVQEILRMFPKNAGSYNRFLPDIGMSATSSGKTRGCSFIEKCVRVRLGCSWNANPAARFKTLMPGEMGHWMEHYYQTTEEFRAQGPAATVAGEQD